MVTAPELATNPLFAVLEAKTLARIAARAADIHASEGEYVTHDGDPPYFWAMLEGEVEALRLVAGELAQMTTFDPDEYFGEVPLMLGSTTIGSIRALRPSRLARIDPIDFHAMIEDSAEAAAILAQTLVRRVGLIGNSYATRGATQALIVGERDDFVCHDIRDFLSRNQVTFEWLDPSDPADIPYLPKAGRDVAAYPVVVFPDGTCLATPTIRELAAHVRLQVDPAANDYDVVIIGGGPSGLAAAVYGGSEGLRTIMIEREAPGGQAGTSSRIENYLGFPSGISGGDLANRAFQQAQRFGVEMLVTRTVTAIEAGDDGHVIRLDGGTEVRTRAIVIASGVKWRKLESAGADRFVGRGVYYGAARTEALGTMGKDIVLIGGGNSAGQAAMFFSNYARTVTLLIRGPALAASMSYYLIEQLKTKANIAIVTLSTVTAIHGETHVERISVEHRETGTADHRADAVFTFIGADADTEWLPAAIERDERGYVRTGRDVVAWPLRRPPLMLETSVPGIFASGDVRSNSVKRVASGVGEGSMVIAFIHEYLAALDVLEEERVPSAR